MSSLHRVMLKTETGFVFSLRQPYTVRPSSCVFSDTHVAASHTHRLLSCAADAAVRWRPFEGAFEVRCHAFRGDTQKDGGGGCREERCVST